MGKAQTAASRLTDDHIPHQKKGILSSWDERIRVTTQIAYNGSHMPLENLNAVGRCVLRRAQSQPELPCRRDITPLLPSLWRRSCSFSLHSRILNIILLYPFSAACQVGIILFFISNRICCKALLML